MGRGVRTTYVSVDLRVRTNVFLNFEGTSFFMEYTSIYFSLVTFFYRCCIHFLLTIDIIHFSRIFNY